MKKNEKDSDIQTRIKELREEAVGWVNQVCRVVIITRQVVIPSYPKPIPKGMIALELKWRGEAKKASLLFKGLLFASVPRDCFEEFTPKE